MGRFKAVVFDAYGTLFDVHSVILTAEAVWPGRGDAVSRLWRAKQLEYTWLRSLMGRYENFRLVTESALVYACGTLGLPLSEESRSRLMEQYLRLHPFPEAPAALAALKPGRQLWIFSNGSPDMLDPLLRHSGLDQHLNGYISVDEVGCYKPDPRAYRLVTARLGLSAAEMLFVSSNAFDAAGAGAFGFHVAWVNRAGVRFDELGVRANATVQSLQELAALADSPD